jgi:hypothetical protein
MSSSDLAAADRGDHVDARARLERGVQPGALAVDVDVDVLAQNRARLAQAVTKTGPLLFETVEHLVDGRSVDLESTRQAGEERRERGWEMELGHDYSTIATSTDVMPGR